MTSNAECPECGHEKADHVSGPDGGCSLCPCTWRKPARKATKPADIIGRLEALTDRERPNGPALRALADEVTEFVQELLDAHDAANELIDQADAYEGTEPGRDGQDERADAWETAQDAAQRMADALATVIEALDQQ